MLTETIHYRGSRSDLVAMLGRLPSIAAGNDALSMGEATGLALRVGTTAMAIQRDAYIVKARGGTDEAGLSWEPLRPSTIRHRLGKTKMSDARRKSIVARYEKRFNEYQREFSRTRRERFNRDVQQFVPHEILRDDGTLFNSLSPGLAGEVRPDGILQVNPGECVGGTNVPYAIYHHSDEPRKLRADGQPVLPQRRLWAEPSQWPQTWWNMIGGSAVRGMALIVIRWVSGRAS